MTQNCPACAATAVRTFPSSRKTGRQVAACSACGCHWLDNPPPPQAVIDYYDFDRGVYEEYVEAKRAESLEQVYDATLDRLDALIGSGGRSLFDVGAGGGEFLLRGRNRGFEPHGNEFAPGAIEMTKDLTGISLHRGDLSTLDGTDRYDAITMWCVLAHVTDPDALLADALRVLKPGGMLFLQTPRWSAMDTAALAMARLSGGRMTRILDRRVSESHMTLHSRKSLSTQASRAGFDIVEVRPRSRYTFKTHEYLHSLGMPRRASQSAARVLDLAVDRDLFFRNVLDLYARKPNG